MSHRAASARGSVPGDAQRGRDTSPQLALPRNGRPSNVSPSQMRTDISPPRMRSSPQTAVPPVVISTLAPPQVSEPRGRNLVRNTSFNPPTYGAPIGSGRQYAPVTRQASQWAPWAYGGYPNGGVDYRPRTLSPSGGATMYTQMAPQGFWAPASARPGGTKTSGPLRRQHSSGAVIAQLMSRPQIQTNSPPGASGVQWINVNNVARSPAPSPSPSPIGRTPAASPARSPVGSPPLGRTPAASPRGNGGVQPPPISDLWLTGSSNLPGGSMNLPVTVGVETIAVEPCLSPVASPLPSPGAPPAPLLFNLSNSLSSSISASTVAQSLGSGGRLQSPNLGPGARIPLVNPIAAGPVSLSSRAPSPGPIGVLRTQAGVLRMTSTGVATRMETYPTKVMNTSVSTPQLEAMPQFSSRWLSALLDSPQWLEAFAGSEFRKLAGARQRLAWAEVCTLASQVCERAGAGQPSVKRLRVSYQAVMGGDTVSPADQLPAMGVVQFQRFARHLLQGVSQGLQDTESGGSPRLVQEFETKVSEPYRTLKVERPTEPKIDDEHQQHLPLQTLTATPDHPPRTNHENRFSQMLDDDDDVPMQEMQEMQDMRGIDLNDPNDYIEDKQERPEYNILPEPENNYAPPDDYAPPEDNARQLYQNAVDVAAAPPSPDRLVQEVDPYLAPRSPNRFVQEPTDPYLASPSLNRALVPEQDPYLSVAATEPPIYTEPPMYTEPPRAPLSPNRRLIAAGFMEQDPYLQVDATSPRAARMVQEKIEVGEDDDDVAIREQVVDDRRPMPISQVAPTLVGKKFIIALRHGRSLAQDAPSARLWSPELADCGLSSAGWRQAELLRVTLAEDDLDLIVCAPLTKALQTALAAFQDLNCPIVVHPALAGDRGGPPEATPRTVEELNQDEALTSLPRFWALDFSLLGTGWPEERPAAGVQAFLPWIRERPETRIAVVGIFGVLRRLLPEVVDFPNCKPLRCVLDEEKLSRIAA